MDERISFSISSLLMLFDNAFNKYVTVFDLSRIYLERSLSRLFLRNIIKLIFFKVIQ